MPTPITRDMTNDVTVGQATVVWSAILREGQGGFPLPGHSIARPRFVTSEAVALQMAKQMNQVMEGVK